MARGLIFVNGVLPDLEAVRKLIQPDDVLIAADGGTRHILALGLVPAILIGDMDSLSTKNQLILDRAGTKTYTYSRNKNETDFELALHYAVEARLGDILVIAALGGRLDQTLGNLSLLTDPSLAGLDIRADDGWAEVFFVHKHCLVQGNPGDLISLIPWGREVTGVTTTGLRWTLSGDELLPHRTRGISNELVDTTASIKIKDGLLLVIHLRQGNGEKIS